MKIGKTINEWRQIEKCLKENFIPIKDTGMTYNANKSLVKIQQALKEADLEKESLDKNFIEKDEKGNPILYRVRTILNKIDFIKDDSGKKIVAKEGQEGRPFVSRSKEYIEAFNQLEFGIDPRETIPGTNRPVIHLTEVELRTVREEEIKELMDQGIITGVDLSPLDGSFIQESEAEQAAVAQAPKNTTSKSKK